MNKYSISIFWSDEDDGYIAVSPEFPGLSAFGKSLEDAIAEVRVALQLFMDSYSDEGLPLPKPQGLQTYSGQFRVRLPKSMHRQAAQLAIGEGISLNSFIVAAVAEKVGAKRANKQITGEMREILNEIRLERNGSKNSRNRTLSR